jgi:signal transduction histidine kinase
MEPPPQRESLDVRALVADVLEAFALLGNRPALHNRVGAGLVAEADREQLTRILTNLVRNAVQALEQVAEAGGGDVVVMAERQGSVTVIHVSDTGPGIPEAVRDRVFSAFRSSAKSGGTGLGLAISAELAEAHGGSLKVARTGPDGTTFTLTLPDPPVQIHGRIHRHQAGS